jgi:REP element-mobilizing transposase RayT
VARAQRQEHAGGLFHVFARGVNRRRIFVDAEDYARYERQLAEVVARQGWNVLAQCSMPNHVHFLIETPEPNLGEGMRLLHGFYAQTFNERHVRVGHLFQGRHRQELIKDDAHLATLVGYVALNPVAAVLCERPEQWRWGSHAHVASGKIPDWLAHERLVELLGSHARYEILVANRLALTLDQPSSRGLTLG